MSYSVVEKVWKGIGRDQDEIAPAEQCSVGYKAKSKKGQKQGLLALTRKANEEENLKIYGGLREERKYI